MKDRSSPGISGPQSRPKPRNAQHITPDVALLHTPANPAVPTPPLPDSSPAKEKLTLT